RFFTLESIAQMFAQAGLQVFDVQARQILGNPGEFQQFQNLFAPLVQALQLDKERFAQQTGALQYVVRALRTPAQPRRLVAHTLVCEDIVTPRIRVYEPTTFLNTIPGFQGSVSVKQLNLTQQQVSQGNVFIWHRAVLGGDSLRVNKELLRMGYL